MLASGDADEDSSRSRNSLELKMLSTPPTALETAPRESDNAREQKE